MSSAYVTIEGTSTAEVVERKSRFIAQLSHASTEDEALEFLESVRAKHAQARHNVYAYRLHGGRSRYSDDGEPAQTSGLPTLEALEHAGLEDVICVTTRYFGGVLLGCGGLVRAYTDACNEAIAAASKCEIRSCVEVRLTMPYQLLDKIKRTLGRFDAKVMSTDYSDVVSMSCLVPSEDVRDLARAIADASGGDVTPDVSEPKLLPF